MKRVLSLVAIGVSLCVMIIGADYRTSETTVDQARRKCMGYTIIEAGKGVDCNGDTIKLVRKHGYFQFESTEKESV